QSLDSGKTEESVRASLRIGWQYVKGVDSFKHGKSLGIEPIYSRIVSDKTATACEGDRTQAQIEAVVIAEICGPEPAMCRQFEGERCPWHHIRKGINAVSFEGREVGIGHVDTIVCHGSQAEFAQLWNHRGQQAPKAGRWCTPGQGGRR